MFCEDLKLFGLRKRRFKGENQREPQVVQRVGLSSCMNPNDSCVGLRTSLTQRAAGFLTVSIGALSPTLWILIKDCDRSIGSDRQLHAEQTADLLTYRKSLIKDSVMETGGR